MELNLSRDEILLSHDDLNLISMWIFTDKTRSTYLEDQHGHGYILLNLKDLFRSHYSNPDFELPKGDMLIGSVVSYINYLVLSGLVSYSSRSNMDTWYDKLVEIL